MASRGQLQPPHSSQTFQRLFLEATAPLPAPRMPQKCISACSGEKCLAEKEKNTLPDKNSITKMSSVHFKIISDPILRKRNLLNAKKKEVNYFFTQVLFLLRLIYCWRESYWENCSPGTELRRPAVKVTHGAVRSKRIYQVIVCVTLHPPPTSSLSADSHCRIHHLCNWARAQREAAAWILIAPPHHSPGGKRAARAHATHREETGNTTCVG